MPGRLPSVSALVIAIHICAVSLGVSQVQDENRAATRDYGFKWVTIGSPGNRGTNGTELPFQPDRNHGSVDYRYRIMTSLVSMSEYEVFADAYAPHYGGPPEDPGFTSLFAVREYIPDVGWGGITLLPDAEPWPAVVSWEMAARMANWIHNGKISEAWAFEGGVYDTTTFGCDPDGNVTHEFTHAPDALVWVPSENEWVKAVHYDPDRFGPDEEGFWTYPNQSETRLFEGLPGQGECIGGLFTSLYPERRPGAWELGQYPNTKSLWGAEDISATYQQWTSTLLHAPTGTVRVGGSRAGDDDYWIQDRLAASHGGTVSQPHGAIRFAAQPTLCNGADLAAPFGTLDYSDVIAFLGAFVDQAATADLAVPFGQLDISDAVAFLELFSAVCQNTGP